MFHKCNEAMCLLLDSDETTNLMSLLLTCFPHNAGGAPTVPCRVCGGAISTTGRALELFAKERGGVLTAAAAAAR